MGSGRTQRVATVAEAQALRSRAAAWDQVAPDELAFDFDAAAPPERAPALDWKAREKVGVKEAIIRWLEEQL